MSESYSRKKGCKDVFNEFLVSNAIYTESIEIPRLAPTFDIPYSVISFRKAMAKSGRRDYGSWVHFYLHDWEFESIWRHAKRYLNRLKKYQGVILPDFSVFRDMPYVMQQWNIYRSRAIGNWLQHNGVRIIPNIRYADSRTYPVSCLGIEEGCVIAFGSLGNIKNKKNREFFLAGFDYAVKKLRPSAVIIYGSAPDRYFGKYKDAGLKIISFESEFAISHKEVM